MTLTKKSVALLLVIGAILVFGLNLIITSSEQKESPNPSEMTSSNSGHEAFLKRANTGEELDLTGQSTVELHIDDFIFKETIVTVDKGTSITWINDGRVRHDVTTADDSDLKSINSQLLANGEKFEHTFNESGIFRYFCSPHPSQMRGIVIVR